MPEIGIFMGYDGEITLSRTNRESPSRVLVSELMILANWLKARFLSDHGLPAVFRSQPNPRDRLYKADEGSLFQNWMQRKLISRVVLGHEAENHTGLGLDAYVTATSPIRKYFDLITQRQLRAALGLERPYTADEIDEALAAVKEPMTHVSRIQFQRNRYWLLKYLEQKVGSREEAIVLNRRRNGYAVLIPAYMMECIIPPASVTLKPEDLIQVTIQQVNARKDVFTAFLG